MIVNCAEMTVKAESEENLLRARESDALRNHGYWLFERPASWASGIANMNFSKPDCPESAECSQSGIHSTNALEAVLGKSYFLSLVVAAA